MNISQYPKLLIDKLADQVTIVVLILVSLSLTGMALMMSWSFLEQKKYNTLTNEGLHFQAALRQTITHDEVELSTIASKLSKEAGQFQKMSQSIFQAHPNYFLLELRESNGKLIKAEISPLSTEKWPAGSRVELPPGVVISFFKSVEEKKPHWAHSYAPSGESALEVVVPSLTQDMLLVVRFNPKVWLPPIGDVALPKNIKVTFFESRPTDDEIEIPAFATPLGLVGIDAYLVFHYKNQKAAGLDLSSVIIIALGLALSILLISYSSEVKKSRKAREQLVQQEMTMARQSQLSTLGEISTTLAHELNQPLATITNYIATCEIRLKQLGYQDKVLDMALNDARGQALRAGEVVQSIRNFLKRGHSVRATVNFEEAVAHLLPILKALAKDHRSVLEVISEPNLCARIDPSLFEQIVINLCKNGLDAMSEVPAAQKKLIVHARTFHSNNELEWARVDVIDKGHGVQKEDADKLFHSFFTTKTHGMGIGLNLSRSIAESHGGRVVWKNNQEIGATFSLELPKHHIAADTPPTQA